MDDVTVVIEHKELSGVSEPLIQRVATVYIGTRECFVFAPSKLTGSALKFVKHFRVGQRSPDGDGWIETDGALCALAVRLVEEKLREVMQSTLDDYRATGIHPEGTYFWGQICLRGHVRHSGGFTIKRHEHCPTCGAECVDCCEACEAPIRGQLIETKVAGYRRPNFCHNCGQAYPWMKDRIDTARDLLNYDDKLTLEQRKELWDLLQYVMSDPKADLVPAKKRLIEIKLESAKQATRELVLDFLAKVTAETLKP